MKKRFHELTKDEFKEIVGNGITYGQLAEEYPQPEWCEYPDATAGWMGCWSLMNHMVKDRDWCKNCECSKDFKKSDPLPEGA